MISAYRYMRFSLLRMMCTTCTIHQTIHSMLYRQTQYYTCTQYMYIYTNTTHYTYTLYIYYTIPLCRKSHTSPTGILSPPLTPRDLNRSYYLKAIIVRKIRLHLVRWGRWREGQNYEAYGPKMRKGTFANSSELSKAYTKKYMIY